MSQFSLPDRGWISTTSDNEYLLPFGWTAEAEVAVDQTRTAVIAGAVPDPIVAVVGTATQVGAGGALTFVALLPNASGWISETRNIEAAIPADGWIAETPNFLGISADIALTVPTPTVAVMAKPWVSAAITGGPVPWSGATGNTMTWKIGQVFDNVPAPASVMVGQAFATISGLLAATLPAPVAAMTGFLTQYPVLGAIAGEPTGPSASMTAFVTQTWPYADIAAPIPAPTVVMTGEAWAGGQITAELLTPVSAMFADASYPSTAMLEAVVPGPSASITARVFFKPYFETVAPESFTVHPDIGEGRTGFADDYRPH